MKTALEIAGLLLLVLVGVAGVQFARVRSQMPTPQGARIDPEPVANLRSLGKLQGIELSRIADGHAGLTVDAKTRAQIFLGHTKG